MNLRQKVKRAKRELVIAEETDNGSSTWDIVQMFQERMRLKKIIDYKKKPSTFHNWNDKYEINWEKLTHISLHADHIELLKLNTSNGKILSNEHLEVFFEDSRLKIYQFSMRVQQRPLENKNYTCYSLVVSNDRTKKKSLHQEKLYFQYDGDETLHPYSV